MNRVVCTGGNSFFERDNQNTKVNWGSLLRAPRPVRSDPDMIRLERRKRERTAEILELSARNQHPALILASVRFHPFNTGRRICEKPLD